MSVLEIKSAIAELPPDELADLVLWIEERTADAWDEEIARDVKAGRFDTLRQRVQAQRSAGECLPQVPGVPNTRTP